jgi:hypothetical protein
MNDERAPAAQRNTDVFAAASDVLDPIPRQGGPERARILCEDDPREPKLRACEDFAGDRAIETSRDRLDFWQFGHVLVLEQHPCQKGSGRSLEVR